MIRVSRDKLLIVATIVCGTCAAIILWHGRQARPPRNTWSEADAVKSGFNSSHDHEEAAKDALKFYAHLRDQHGRVTEADFRELEDKFTRGSTGTQLYYINGMRFVEGQDQHRHILEFMADHKTDPSLKETWHLLLAGWIRKQKDAGCLQLLLHNKNPEMADIGRELSNENDQRAR